MSYYESLGSVYPLKSQKDIFKKRINNDVVRNNSVVRDLTLLNRGIIPVFKPGDQLYELGRTSHPFVTAASVFSPLSEFKSQ